MVPTSESGSSIISAMGLKGADKNAHAERPRLSIEVDSKRDPRLGRRRKRPMWGTRRVETTHWTNTLAEEVRSAVLPEAGVELSIWISADRSGQATIMVEDVVGRVADSVIGRIGQMADCLVEVAQVVEGKCLATCEERISLDRTSLRRTCLQPPGCRPG